LTKFRGFIAIDIETNQKIIELFNKIGQTGANLKIVEPQNIHITLKFLGDTDEKLIEEIEQIIEKSVKENNPFEIKLTGTGVFPNPGYIKVVWIGIEENGIIGEIAGRIDEQTHKLGFERDKRRFSPHLTIARVKSAKNKDRLIQVLNQYSDTEFIKFKVESIKLKKSELTPKGPIYTTLKEIKI
jgi:2'-5' RNA ligase